MTSSVTISVGRHLNRTVRLQLAIGFVPQSGPEGFDACGNLPDIFLRKVDMAGDDLTTTASSATVKSKPKMRSDFNHAVTWH
jgi:hypothetical protein